MMLAAGGLSIGMALTCVLALLLPLWLLAQAGIWLSVFGPITTMACIAVTVAGFTVPLAMAAVAMLVPGRDLDLTGMTLVAIFHGAILGGTTWFYLNALRQLKSGPDGVLDWFLCRIHTARRRIEVVRIGQASGKASPAFSGALAGALSVTAYPVLQAWLPEQAVLIFCVCFTNGLALWLNVWIMSRWLAQAIALKAMEREQGQRYVTDRLEWLESERGRFRVGRWLRRLWPCPVPLLDADKVDLSPPPSHPKRRKNASA